MRSLFVLVGFLLATVSSALGADLGSPPKTVAEALPAAPTWRNCAVEVAGGARAAKVAGSYEKIAIAAVGGTCSYNMPGSPFVMSLFVSYAMQLDTDSESALLTFNQPVTAGLRVGYAVQPNLQLFGSLGYAYGKDDDRGIVPGVGLDLKVSNSFHLVGQYQAQLTNDDITIHQILIGPKFTF